MKIYINVAISSVKYISNLIYNKMLQKTVF